MNQREQFNLVVVGHVDHGKSTVIGRLLADTGSLPDGRLEQVRQECARSAKPFEYAFLLDALKAEQAQGITIDTARCFFKSALRDYIIIDAPGHIEFLKNMITGAARAEAALLVIDAKEGVRENSRRHGAMLSMLGIRQVIVVVNKMDLANYRQEVFTAIETEYRAFLSQVGIEPITFVPIAAFHGVNLSQPSPGELPWYQGPCLLEWVDRLQKETALEQQVFRLPVQDIYKFTEAGDDRRIIAGRIESGRIQKGDKVVFYPSGKKAVIKTLEEFNRPVQTEFSVGKSAGFTLEPEIYVKSGEVMAIEGQAPPRVGNRLRANIFWMGKIPFVPGKKYKLKLTTAEVPVWLETIHAVMNASDLTREVRSQVEQYEVGECVLETLKPVAFDLSSELAPTSRFVIVDGYEIAGGGIVLGDLGNDKQLLKKHLQRREQQWTRSPITSEMRSQRYGQRATLIVITAPGAVDLTPLGVALEEYLFVNNRFSYFLGLNNARLGLQADQTAEGTWQEDRSEVLRRLGEVAHLFTDAGAVLITAVNDLDDDDLEVLQSLARPADVLTITATDQPLGEQVRNIGKLLFDRSVLLEYYL